MAEQANIVKSRDKGFTLVELAIVLVIVGMLVGLGSGMMGMLTTAIKVREAKDNVEAAVQSVTSWASANNRVPDTAAFPQAATSSKDSWGRDLVYLYDANLNINPTKDTICGRRTTQLTLSDPNSGATVSNVAFLVLSKSDDANVQATLNGKLNGAAINGIITGTGGYATGAITLDSNNSDIVRWVTLDELRTKVGCQGAPLKIVNNELPFGNYSSPYSATFVPDGGAGGLEWRLKMKARPTGISFQPVLPFTNTSTSNWVSGNTLTIQGALRPQASYSLIVMLKDSDGNSTSKSFVLTINPKNP